MARDQSSEMIIDPKRWTPYDVITSPAIGYPYCIHASPLILSTSCALSIIWDCALRSTTTLPADSWVCTEHYMYDNRSLTYLEFRDLYFWWVLFLPVEGRIGVDWWSFHVEFISWKIIPYWHGHIFRTKSSKIPFLTLSTFFYVNYSSNKILLIHAGED